MKTDVKIYSLAKPKAWWFMFILLSAYTASILTGIADFGKGRSKNT